MSFLHGVLHLRLYSFLQAALQVSFPGSRQQLLRLNKVAAASSLKAGGPG